MQRERARRGLVSIAAVVVILAGLKAASEIVVPVLLALFLAFVSTPLVFKLSRARVPYGLAVTLVLLLQLAILSAIGMLLAQSASDFKERLPDLRAQLSHAEGDVVSWIAQHTGMQLHEASALVSPDLFDRLGDAALGLGALLSSAVLMVLVLGFTLFDASHLWRVLDQRFSDGGREKVMSTIASEVNRYLGIKTSISVLMGILSGTWCWLLGLELALFWGLLAFILNYVPNIGPIIAGIPPVLLAFLVQGPAAAVLVAFGFAMLHLVLGNIVEPKVMGSALGLSSTVVMVSIVGWGWLFGPVGALLSVPLTMIVKLALASSREWSWVADLMSGPRPQEALAPETARPREQEV